MAAESLARGGVVSLAGSAFAALSALAVTAVIGRSVGADGTGVFFQAVGIYTILTQVLRLGTNSGIVRFIAEERAFGRVGGEWRVVLFAVLPVAVIAGLASIAMWFWSDALSRWLAAPGEAEPLAGLLRAMVPFIALGAVIGVLQIAARMLRGVGTFTVLQNIGVPGSRVIAVLIAAFGAATAWTSFEAWLWPIPVWFVITLVVTTGPIVRDLRRRSMNHSPPRFGRFWRFSAPRSVSSGLETALEWADVLIVAALASPATAGVYAVATRAVRAGGIVDKAMRVAVAPRISALLARGERANTTELHTLVVRTMILLNWPFYVSLITMGPSVLAVFGAEFVAGAGPMMLLAGALMLQTAAGMLQSILLQGGRSTWQMWNKAVALALSIGGNLLLVPPLGLWGAAITWFVVVFTDNTIAAIQVHAYMGVRLQPTRLVGAAVVPVVVFGAGGWAFTAVFGTAPLLLVPAVVMLGLAYAVILWFLRRRLDIVQLWRRVPFIGRAA